MSRSAAELSAKLGAVAKSIPDMQKVAARESAMLVKQTALAHLGQAIGADLVMSGAGKGKGAKLGVRFDVGQKGQAETTAFVRAVGPWQLVESRNRPHLIGPKGVRVSARRKGTRAQRLSAIDAGGAVFGKSDVLRFSDGSFRRWAAHPGTRGKYPWRNAMVTVVPRVPPVWVHAYRAAVAKQFRG